MTHLKLNFFLLLSIIFIIDPELFLLSLELIILELLSLFLKLGILCVITNFRIRNLFKTKRLFGLGIFTDVNDATIATFYKTHVKCVTIIDHPAFSEEDLLTVEEYDDEVAAKAGHEKWVKYFEKWLPKELKDVKNNTIYKREFFE